MVGVFTPKHGIGHVYRVCAVGGSLMAGSEDEDLMFLVGDLNMRLWRLTGDLIANLRSNIRYTLRDMELSWVRPNSGKWTVQTSRERSIVDYIFVNQKPEGW